MTPEKKPLSETAFDRKLDLRIKELQDAQAKRDAEQDARLQRPSRAMAAVGALEKVDFTKMYPKSSTAIGLAIFVGATVAHGALKWIETVPMYVAWGIAVGFVPGLVMSVVRLATGLKKAKE